MSEGEKEPYLNKGGDSQTGSIHPQGPDENEENTVKRYPQDAIPEQRENC
jgi:hypothetical protein